MKFLTYTIMKEENLWANNHILTILTYICVLGHKQTVTNSLARRGVQGKRACEGARNTACKNKQGCNGSQST